MQHTALARDNNSLAGIAERDVQGRLLGGDEECPAARLTRSKGLPASSCMAS